MIKNGYLLAEQRELASEWWMALTPGATDLMLEHFAYERVERPLFPLDREFPEPELTPVVVR